MPASAATDVVDICGRIHGATKLEAAATVFRDAIARDGFDTYACGEIDVADRDLNVFFIIDWPESWRKFYIESGLVAHDPVVGALEAYGRPFTWSELRNDRRLKQAESRALRLAYEHGWREGVFVPIPRGGSRYGLVTMVGRAPAASEQVVSRMAVVSRALMDRVRMLSPKRFPVPPAGLTERQIDCLRLVAEGLSDREIGRRLGIASGTAHEHVEMARKRFKAATRAQALARALSLGIV